MLFIQIVILAFSLFAIAAAVGRHRRGHLARPWLWTWVLFWLAVAVVALVPDVTTAVAGWFGVGRGVDLLFYLAFLGIFYVLFRMFVRIEGLEQEITRLVRALALSDESGEKTPKDD